MVDTFGSLGRRLRSTVFRGYTRFTWTIWLAREICGLHSISCIALFCLSEGTFADAVANRGGLQGMGFVDYRCIGVVARYRGNSADEPYVG